jgi:hypothetical protein
MAKSKINNKANKLTIKEVNEKVEKLSDNVSQLVELLSKKQEEKTESSKQTETVQPESNKDIRKEGIADWAEVHPVHDNTARDILGNLVDRTYMKYPKGGGALFTVVIKREFSNAPKDYLERMKEDHRTANLETERFRGEEGAKRWCLLIKQNLSKNK